MLLNSFGLKSSVDKWNSSFSNGRNVFKRWTLIFINLIMVQLTPDQLYLYLVESGFILNSKVKCNNCGGYMTIADNTNKPEKKHFVCRNQILATSSSKLVTCAARKSILTNTWFSKSKLKTGKYIT